MSTFFELTEVISQDELLNYLDWSPTTMWEQVRLKDDPFAWINGIHYFQLREKGKLTFNKRMIEVWLVAKSQRDPQMHLNAIDLFQRSVPGTTARGRKNIAQHIWKSCFIWNPT